MRWCPGTSLQGSISVPTLSNYARFEIEQVQLGSGASAAVPTLSTWALLMLAALSVLATFVQMRKPRKA
ncbi:hypothetical protein B1808_04355 [Pseudofulvimonas gallinarii]|uniref:IPTL-CTERM sorting domain-containing protein n=1 Tax=Pseudofulvimonas gallinarii TaxID=634155 RepID=UPI000F489A79|nr:hypothetical protein B1808_04355 [Pseudofulvimonas gallinarii]